MITRGYCAVGASQLHWRETGLGDRVLLCLHPAPHSGLFFETVMPMLASGRRVIAPDYPGYGASSAPEAPPAIDDYALAMLALLEKLAPACSVSLLGFHTGCLVAAEMARLAPTTIDNLVLVDVPYFTGEEQRKMLGVTAVPMAVGPGAESVVALWEKNVTQRLDTMPLARATALFAEQLQVAERAHFAFRAAFTYACRERMGAVRRPVHIIATRSGLLEATRDCASIMPAARFEERLDIRRAVFEEGAVEISHSINAALDGGKRGE